jgi:serine protease AprX
MSRPQVFNRLVTLAVLLSLCSALFVYPPTKVQAANNAAKSAVTSSKISPDLRQLILSGQGDKRVKVIVQQMEETSGGGLLGGLLNTVGGLLEGVLSLLNIRIVDVQVNDVELLATDPNVSYISLDTAVRSSGHLTTTTGTQQVRVQKTLLGTNNLDGSGVTIAVLDSGIDKGHKSFATAGKIKFSKDFTGENRVDDPWGHGTHVAAIAAGDGAPTGGAYEGIAPGANLVNLRVLNAKGSGRVSGVLSALEWVLANKNSYNIRVVNMSLGTLAINSYKDDPPLQSRAQAHERRRRGRGRSGQHGERC